MAHIQRHSGWQTFAVKYRTEILQHFARMYAMRDQVLPVNRAGVEYYVRLTWIVASELTKSLRAPAIVIPDYAEEKFGEYVRFEEDRIRNNLIGIKYDIDALETVYGVVGPGRIEKVCLVTLLLALTERNSAACSYTHVPHDPKRYGTFQVGDKGPIRRGRNVGRRRQHVVGEQRNWNSV